jgi:predicted ferric reductase
MGLGILAFYALLIVAGSSYFIKYFRRWVWRWLHYGIYAVFGLGLIHSLYISPDYLSGWVLDYFDGEKLIVVIMVAITVLFLLWRIFMLQRPNAQRKPTQAQQQRRSATALVQVPVENQG